MPCKLNPYQPGLAIFASPTGSDVSLYIGSASGLAKLSAATYRSDPLVVDNDRAVSFTVEHGIQLLRLNVVSPDARDTVQVFEDCGEGQSQKLSEYPYDPNDPPRGYRIVGI